MSGQWSVPAWLALAALVVVATLLGLVVVLGVATRAQRRRAGRESADLRRRVAAVEDRLAARGAPAATAAPAPAEDYVITRLGDDDPEHRHEPARASVPTLPPGAFTDIVVREGVLRTAALAHGVRRALSPEVRHRVRLEMRREVKRARKARRAEQREALRDWQARRRAEEAA